MLATEERFVPRRWLPYVVAFLAVGAALGLRLALDPWLGARVPFITLFGAVIVAAWYGGAVPALVAAIGGWVGCELLFIEPRGAIAFRGTVQVIEVLAYALSTLLIGALGGAMHRARRRAEESEQRFRAFMQNSPNAVFLKDEAGRYVFISRAGEALLGRSDWLGRTDDELLPAPSSGTVRSRDREVLQADAPRIYDLALRTPLGERILRSVKFPLRDAAGQRYVGSITMDVTEQRRAEAVLREADRRKDQFIATLAHELRNPLAPIRTAVEILGREGTTEPDRAWSRAVIQRQVAHMGRLVDDLLDTARISSGKLLLRRQRVELAAVVAAALETSRPALDAAGHRLETRMPAAHALVDADLTRLAQVLSNLLNNAAKYTPPGGRIELCVEQSGADALITVADNGLGFPPDLSQQLFEPFAQWAPAEHAAPGLGIGLALVRGIVELHGGTASASSEGPGKGSRFEVRLPLAAAAPGAAQRAPDAPPVAPPGVRVLVADDNRDAADTLCRLLALYGYEVRSAYDGGAALETCESFLPHAAVLDIGMPGRNGYDVARALRERRGDGIRLVAVSGWGSEADVQRAREAGFDHHLTKPVDPAQLNEVLGRR
jgi:PAS domain S-box-containing protein